MSARVAVRPLEGDAFAVEVREGGSRTEHRVEVTAEHVQRYAPGASPERLLEASFRFLLEREPKESILGSFALPVIERYFPEYPGEIRRRVSAG